MLLAHSTVLLERMPLLVEKGEPLNAELLHLLKNLQAPPNLRVAVLDFSR